MRQLMIIPDRKCMNECLEMADKYQLGFEYNDFFNPNILDDENEVNKIIAEYKNYNLPQYTTLHGDFFDVLPFSEDAKIREISDIRVKQSIDVAKKIGAKAVVFHTNYNPFLNTKHYVDNFVEHNVNYWGRLLETNEDINIYLENMFDRTPCVMEAISEGLKDYKNYGVCMDYAHAYISEVEPQIWARDLSKYIKHIHINDNDGISDLHLAWGEGKINRNTFYKCYEKYMEGATVLIETSKMVNKKSSLEVFAKEGFISI